MQTDLVRALELDRFAEPERARIATLPVDVEPAETNVVFANGFRWQPEPVFQSYSAYTPALDRLDAASLISVPRRVLYRNESIDGREPFAESPLARATLLCRYRADPAFGDRTVETEGGTEFAVLVPGPNRCSVPSTARHVRVTWNETIVTPRADPHEVVLALARIRLTFFGAFVRFAYHAPPVYATFVRSGASSELRILPDQAGDGILVDPLPADTAAYARFSSGRLAPSTLSMRFTSDDAALYEPAIDVTFVRMRYR